MDGFTIVRPPPTKGGLAGFTIIKPRPTDDPTVNRGVVGETVRAFKGGVDRLKENSQALYSDVTSRKTAPNLIQGLKDTASDIGRMGAIAGDALSIAAAPVTGVTEALAVKPAARALSVVPRYGPDVRTGPVQSRPGERLSRGEGEVAWQGDVRNDLMAVTPRQAPVRPPVTAVTPKITMADTVQAFDRAGVTPSLAATQGKGAATITNTVAENFLAGAPTRARLRRNLDEVASSADRIASGYGSNRGPMIAGENVQSGVKRFATDRNAATSFSAKSARLYDDAFAAIPNTAVVPREAATTLNDIMTRVSAPALADAMKAPKIEQIAKALATDQGRVSFSDLRELRSWVRGLRKAAPDLRQGIAEADLKRLEGALTRDIYSNASTLGGPEAARKLQQTDRFYAVGSKRIQNALKAFDGADGAKSGESTFARIQQAAGSNASADAQKLLSLKRSLSPDEWGDVAATQIKHMGRPTKGAAEGVPDDAAFSISNFVSNYANMSPRARKIMFGSIGGGGSTASSLADELDNLVNVAGALKGVEKGANASKTAVNVQGAVSLAGLVGAATGHVSTGLLASVLGSFVATGEMMTNPVAVRAIAGLAKASRQGSRALNGQMGRLRIQAQTNPILLPVYVEAQRALLAPPIEAATPVAASEERQ